MPPVNRPSCLLCFRSFHLIASRETNQHQFSKQGQIVTRHLRQMWSPKLFCCLSLIECTPLQLFSVLFWCYFVQIAYQNHTDACNSDTFPKIMGLGVNINYKRKSITLLFFFIALCDCIIFKYLNSKNDDSLGQIQHSESLTIGVAATHQNRCWLYTWSRILEQLDMPGIKSLVA